VRKALVFLCARGGRLVVTDLDRLPPESTEVEDPGVVGLAAADLVDVYVAARAARCSQLATMWRTWRPSTRA